MSCITRIVSAAPALRVIGLSDQGSRPVPIPSRAIPQHVPLWIFQSERGPIGHRLTDPSELSLIYGNDITTLTAPHANHQVLGMSESMQEGNIGVTYRVSKGTRSNISIGIDIMPATLTNYERRVDGSIQTDVNGNPVVHPTIPTVQGYSCKIIQRTQSISDPSYFGELQTGNGVQVDDAGNPSTYYPIIELMEENPGSFGNNNGFILFAPEGSEIDKAEALRQQSFPYIFAIATRDNDYDTGSVAPTKYRESSIEVHFNPDAKSKYDDSTLYFTDMVRDRYNNTKDPDLDMYVGPYNSYIKVYKDNLDTILKMLYEAERQYVLANPTTVSSHPIDPITPQGGEEYLFNWVSGKDMDGVPYYSFTYDVQGNTADGVLLTKHTKLWSGQGRDNWMSTTEYEREVRKILMRYGDCQDVCQDLATHPENWFYDTGFSFYTKKYLKEFISQRPDTIVACGTGYDTMNIKGWIEVPDPNPLPPDWIVPEISELSEAEELQLGGILESEFRSKPESSFYGTPCTRAFIFGNTAESTAPGWNRRVNYTHYLIGRASRRFGAANGKWKKGAGFSGYPGSVIRSLLNTSVRWIPYSSRVSYWKRSINFPLSYDYDYDFMPAIQGVYPIDSSTLNALPNVQMITRLWTVAYMAWRRFSGVDDLAPEDLKRAVKGFVIETLRGNFDDSFNIAVIVYFTKDDEDRGYSWTLKYKVEQGMMYTVESVIIESYRFNQIADGELIRV